MRLLNRGLLSIVAFDRGDDPALIGTGFVIAAAGHRAVGCTAAHNLAEVGRLQGPARAHHPTALREFLPRGAELDLDRKRLRALSWEGSQVEMAILDWAIWDERADIAFFSIRTQDEKNTTHFQSHFILDAEVPETGAEVAVLGFQDMRVDSNELANSSRRFTISRQLMLRCGRVSAIHPDGHLLCKGLCMMDTSCVKACVLRLLFRCFRA